MNICIYTVVRISEVYVVIPVPVLCVYFLLKHIDNVIAGRCVI